MLHARHTCFVHPMGYLQIRVVGFRVGHGVFPLSQRTLGRDTTRVRGRTGVALTTGAAGAAGDAGGDLQGNAFPGAPKSRTTCSD